MLAEVVRGIRSLFVDDELLAIGVLGVVGFTMQLINVFGTDPLVAGAALLCGNLLFLGVGAARIARRRVSS